jgi:hypothetical protein
MESITQELKVKTPKAKPVRTVAAIMGDIQSQPIEYRIARSTAIGTELEASELERWCVNSLTYHQGAENNIDEPGSRRGAYINLGQELTKASNLRWLSDSLAKSPVVIAARAVLDRLVDELEVAIERERIHAQDAAFAARELEAAKESARLELEGQIDNHPAVIEAVRKLEPFKRLGDLVH